MGRLRELKENNFVELESASVEDFRIVHAVTRHHIFNTLPETVLRTAASDVIGVIRQAPLQVDTAHDFYTQLVLSDLAGDREAVLRLTLPTASQLMFSGSYRPALSAYSIGLSAGESLGDLELWSESLIGVATVLLNTGYYQAALNRLDSRPTSTLDHLLPKISLLRGEILMRLNRYPESLSELERAHKLHNDQNEIEGQLAAEKIRNTILRDLFRANLN